MSRHTIRKSILKNNLLTVSLPLFLFVFFTLQYLIGSLESGIINRNQIIATTLAEQFNTMQQEPIRIVNLIHTFSKDEELISSHLIDETLASIQKTYPYILNIEILNDAGDVLHSAIKKEDIGINRSGENFFQQMSNQIEGYYWSTPYMSTSIGQLTYSLSYKTKEGKYIIVYSSLQSLSESSRSYAGQFGEEVYVVIVDNYGKYISHENIENVHFRMMDKNIEEIKDVAKGLISHATVTIDDTRYVLNATSMPLAKWYVVVYQPTDTVFGLLQKLIFIMSLIVVLTAIATFIYTWLYSGRIHDFIVKMQASFDYAIEHNYNVDLSDFGYDDLNDLGRRFSSLMSVVTERDSTLLEMAYKDQLTGLSNRLYMSEVIDQSIAKQPNTPLTLCLINIDGFKIINDVYSHDIGDELLIYISHELKRQIAHCPCDLFRIGADEFALLIYEHTSEEKLKSLLHPLKECLVQGVLLNSRLVRVGISSGMVHYPEQTKEGKKLVQYADMALIETKDHDRGNVKTFNTRMKEKIQNQSGIDHLLRKSLKDNMFELHFQPQVSAIKEEIVGFEALIRLRKDNGDLVNPYEFIHIAEGTGLIIEIGEWVLREAIGVILEINALYSKNYCMSINLSTVQMSSPLFVDTVLNIIKSTGVDQSLLDFEITESVFINAESIAFDSLRRLHAKGLRFSLDDFGTGYSSLSYLTTMPFQILKIDRSFIADVESITAKRNMLESIIAMGHKLNFKIVAEGVETMEQYAICKKYNCDIIQGYLFSRPLPFDQLVAYIKRYNNKLY